MCVVFFFLEDTITMHTISISICVIGKVKVHLISHPSLTRRGSRRASSRGSRARAFEAQFFSSRFIARHAERKFQGCLQTMIYRLWRATLLACVLLFNCIAYLEFGVRLWSDRMFELKVFRCGGKGSRANVCILGGTRATLHGD